MTIPDETLMAYADGELDDAAAAVVAAAVRDDRKIAARVAEHRALRARVRAAYEAELAEPVPARLVEAAMRRPAAAAAEVLDIGAARGQRVRPRWQPLLSIAASLLIGVAVGFLMWRQSDSMIRQDSRGALVAGGSLARALSSQFAGERKAGVDANIGLSFLSKSGLYCRTFNLSKPARGSGLACRTRAGWQIEVLAQSATAGPTPEYRTAGSAVPPAVLQAVEAQIAGTSLDHAGEVAARRHDWRGEVR